MVRSNKMIYRQITSADSAIFSDALELLNRTQGRDLFNPSYLDRRTSDPDSLVIGAFNDGVLVAVGVAQVLKDQFDFYSPFDPNMAAELATKVVGSFSTLCVHETFQGKGIGQEISKLRLRWLQSRACEVIVGISWVSGLAHTSDRVFEKMGFGSVKRIENFFYQSSIENPFHCPGCGDPPCTCAGILYRLDL